MCYLTYGNNNLPKMTFLCITLAHYMLMCYNKQPSLVFNFHKMLPQDNAEIQNLEHHQMATSHKTAEEIDQAYRSEPWWYDLRGFFILTFAYRSTLWRQMRLFGGNMGRQHLEVACGTGTLLEMTMNWRRRNHLNNAMIHVTGVDYAERMLDGAKHRFRTCNQFEFLRADAANMNMFNDETFDTINIANSIHCLPEVEKSLREMFRVLKEGGTCAGNVLLYSRGFWPFKQIAAAINKWGIKRGILVTPFTEGEILDEISKAGFEIVWSEVSGNCLEFIARRPHASTIMTTEQHHQVDEFICSNEY